MSDYRNIAPSGRRSSATAPGASQQQNISAQESSPSQTAGTSTNEEGQAGGSSKQGGGTQRRRRIPGQVATLACTECRKARAKCNGERPESCRRCLERDLRCIYEMHTKTHKDDLIREIEAIKAVNANLQIGNQNLATAQSNLEIDHKELQLKQENLNVILDILTNNGHDREIIKRLRAGDSHDSIAKWLLQEPHLTKHMSSLPASQKTLLVVVKRVEELYNGGDSRTEKHRWTSITKSETFIGHLFELYFTWVHPVHMLFSEIDFLEAYERGSDDKEKTYCSSALVNAICAMGCLLLEDPQQSPKPPEETSNPTYEDAMQLCEAFIKEARARLVPDEYSLWTSIQAFAVIHLVDLSCGKARSATGYMRSAADNLKIRTQGLQSSEAIQLSYWGVHTLNTVWSGFTYQKPFAPESPRSDVLFDLQSDKDEGQWHFHQHPGDDLDNEKREGFGILTACHHAKLFRIVHDAINIYCGARGKVTAQAVVGCYKRFLDWHDNLPPQLKIEETPRPLPHVLSLHIQYHTAIIQLLAPLLRSQSFSSFHSEEIRVMIIQHARIGLDLLFHSVQLYTSRYHMPITTFCVIHLGDTMVRYSSEEEMESRDTAIRLCLETLQKTRTGFGLCGPLQQMFRLTVRKHGIVLPNDIVSKMGSPGRYGVDDILDACTRLDYSQPIDQILGYLHPKISENWQVEWWKQIDEPKRREQSDELRRASGIPPTSRVEINSLLNR